MLDITVIILTYNEELHICRCLKNVNTFAKKIYVIDCYSTDKTATIAQELGAEVVFHKWPGNQAEQFNWALDNIQIDTEWILRLDADEYVTPELKHELETRVSTLKSDVSAIVFPLGRAFMGKVLKHGIVNGIKMIRMFRYGKVRYEQRLMDEHLHILEGEIITFEHKFVDDNRNSIKYFIEKHNNYSSREAALLLDAEYELINTYSESYSTEFCKEIQIKRVQKQKYANMPLFWRAFGYFCYRYIVKLGFLDGKEGFLWDFLQGWWYRTLVDAKVFEIKKACGMLKKNTQITSAKKDELKKYIKENWKISL